MPSSPPAGTPSKASGESTTAKEGGTDERHAAVAAVPPGHELIVEGTARMVYPKGDGDAVFYNPVQVQNRDLSVLMLGMYAERRAKRNAVRARRKELLREAREKAEAEAEAETEEAEEAVADGDGGGAGGSGSCDGAEKKDRKRRDRKKKKGARIDEAKIQVELDAYAESVDWTERVRGQKAEGSGNDADGASSNDADGGSGGGEGMRILDALAASGLRSIRYWREVPGVRQIVINDLDPVAVQRAKDNVAFNGLEGVLLPDVDGDDGGQANDSDADAAYGIRVQNGDATHVMYSSRRPPGMRPSTMSAAQFAPQRDQFDVIDLDPYGSAAPFVDGAVQSVASGGMLAVTCTDMAALGGSHPETCYGRYGSMPVPRARYLQELAVRILLYNLSSAAARYGRTIRPVLSVGMAFYVRVFVEVWDDKAGVNNLSLNHGSVYQSTQCPSFHIIPHGVHGNKNRNVYQPARGPPAPCCEETGGPFKVAGPVWLGPLHDFAVVDEAVSRLEREDGGTVHPLKTKTALHGLLTVVGEELPDVPLYYTLPDLCHTVRCQCPPLGQIKAALTNAGYRVSAYHKEPQALKTDAPNSVVWDVVRAWCKEHPPKKDGKNSKKRTKKRQRMEGSAGEEEGKDGQELSVTADGGDKDGSGMSAGEKILAVEPTIAVDFSIPKGFENKKKAQRFPMNPEANWGPKKAASGKRKATHGSDAASQGEPDFKVAKADVADT